MSFLLDVAGYRRFCNQFAQKLTNPFPLTLPFPPPSPLLLLTTFFAYPYMR